jgi:putative flippase GtrA
MISRRFIRFCAIGGASAACSLTMLALLVDVARMNYLIGFALTFVTVNCVSYVASRRFAFESTTVRFGAGLLRYFGVMIFGLALNTAAMAILVGGLDLAPMLAAAILCVLGAPMNFLLHRQVTFAVGRSGRS